MRKNLIVLLIFFPITLLGQELECCKTTSEVEDHLNGYWQMKDSNPKEQIRFEFNNGNGRFWKYTLNHKGEVTKSEEIDQTLEIFKSESGFEIDWSNGNRIGTSQIKILNPTNLVFVRRDGKKTEFSKIID
ncbi:hypothetical protein EZV76_10820 [Flagellimonas alvinocaridis]|uniref:Lipocalin-like domain-containing protein n=1 Tax=Flagellimonas alvinocaridis TaxID=2530200 RepID=A0A4S8RMM8_9FLAO|nr:hypothetical protein [Allomuricauda alvinocaridis]THV59310.1 hypothetical protein EZV76_10820 [Allomuricauda alvinocaridis]